MNARPFSDGFQRLYCAPTVFEAFSGLHPINFRRVLPFQTEDPAMDDARLLSAEAAHLAARNDDTRRNVVDAFYGCGLLTEGEATNVKSVIDAFDADFFELMGDVYANAGMFICALRWHREFMAYLEAENPNMASDAESVYASVGYCLYALGLYEEAVAWSKSCIGPRQIVDTVSRTLIDYEAQMQGGCIRGVERTGWGTRYTMSTFDAAESKKVTPRLKTALHSFAPFQQFYFDWIDSAAPAPQIESEGYPFQPERDGGSLVRHRMNLIFASYELADALTARGRIGEARRVLVEAAMLEPQAEFIRQRIKELPSAQWTP